MGRFKVEVENSRFDLYEESITGTCIVRHNEKFITAVLLQEKADKKEAFSYPYFEDYDWDEKMVVNQ
jgi:hypothetical protein